MMSLLYIINGVMSLVCMLQLETICGSHKFPLMLSCAHGCHNYPTGLPLDKAKVAQCVQLCWDHNCGCP